MAANKMIQNNIQYTVKNNGDWFYKSLKKAHTLANDYVRVLPNVTKDIYLHKLVMANNIYYGRGTAEMFDDYMDFINYVFGFNGNSSDFKKLLPKLYKYEYEQYPYHTQNIRYIFKFIFDLHFMLPDLCKIKP